MKSAMVIGARQALGFELCRELLEQGYIVQGKDFEQWTTEEQEEKWFYIGRNANLHFEHLRTQQCLNVKNLNYLWLPLIDFYQLQSDHEVIQQLEALLEQLPSASSLVIVFIQPIVVERKWAELYKRLENRKKLMRKNRMKVIEILIWNSDQEQNKDYFVCINDHREWIVQNSDHENLALEMIHQLEMMKDSNML